MAQTIELELTRRWRVRVLSERGASDVVVDSDQELTAKIMHYAGEPTVLDIRCERYFGPTPSLRCGIPALATADRDQADSIRAAAEEVFIRVDELRRVLGWPYVEFEQRASATTNRARAALSGLAADAPTADLIAAVKPILGECWPAPPTLVANASQAVDRLRAVVAGAEGTAGRHLTVSAPPRPGSSVRDQRPRVDAYRDGPHGRAA